ncbi:unnamed protein product [Rotaria sp. Silwood1]|nr:unnamed protein product [Rotaria sp. Silwood1]CAF3416190.1 unnamed protein product [Rotaria sp. Silwood1]CAF3425574.1 unnamed protein product [Rotaria sp. Silwood1]CAF3433970.1 unnamed protein product [Rotaria sp. Silwood1]CAF4541215.1 unnamed protein product [Rotaria sp. Silwood1]
MSRLPPPTSVSNVWSAAAGSSPAGPTITGPIQPGGGYPTGLSTVNNPNLPTSTTGSIGNPPPIPPFTFAQQLIGPANSFASNDYATANTLPSVIAIPTNLVPNTAQTIQNETNTRRLKQLEDENMQRRKATISLQQMGTHILQSQMDVQEQVLQYQFMLEQCMETLDYQNFLLSGQAEELALIRAKMRHFEYFMDAIKQMKKIKLRQNILEDFNINDCDLFNTPNPLLPLFTGRLTASQFQPLDPPYRSSIVRSSKLNESRRMTPSMPHLNTDNARLSRPISNLNN